MSARYWCTKCGNELTVPAGFTSIDPRYAVGVCGSEATDLDPAPERQGVDSQERAWAIIQERKTQRARVNHERHWLAGKPSKSCAACQNAVTV